MKNILLFTALLFLTFSNAQDSKLVASCCDVKEAKAAGRCSGDAYCTACSNCKYCKHCNSGGSCGVCTSYSAPVQVKKKTTYKKANSSKGYYTISGEQPSSSYAYGDPLIVATETLNLREGAGSSYAVVEKLSKGAILTFVSVDGDWLFVKVTASGNSGYVYYKYVQ